MTHTTTTTSASLFYSAQVAQAREQFLSLGISLVLPLVREIGVDCYEVVENQYVVDAARSLYDGTSATAKWEKTGCYVITPKKGILFSNVDVVSIVNQGEQPAPMSTKEVAEEPTDKDEPKPAPKSTKATKAVVAKAGGVKSKAKPIVDMKTEELKKLADKNSISYEGINFRKADERDAFRSRLAKALDRTSEMNYSVK